MAIDSVVICLFAEDLLLGVILQPTAGIADCFVDFLSQCWTT